MKQKISGGDWMRREEEVAKLQHDLPGHQVWDVGVGKGLQAIIPAAIMPNMVKERSTYQKRASALSAWANVCGTEKTLSFTSTNRRISGASKSVFVRTWLTYGMKKSSPNATRR